MKKNLLTSIPLLCLLGGFTHAQEAKLPEKPMPSRIVGEIADGKPSPPAPPKKQPNFKIHWSKSHQVNGQSITFNKVAALPPADMEQKSVEPLGQAEITRRARKIEQWIESVKQSGGFFTVSATIYDHKTTYVRWWNGKEEYACYSNVDWNHLGGFHEFVGRGKRFSMILFSANSSIKQMREDKRAGYRNSLPKIPSLPNLATHGARYMVIKGDEGNDDAMEFIEAIHDLYDENKAALVKAWQERKKNHEIYRRKQEALRRNPKPKPPLVINWTIRKDGVEQEERKRRKSEAPSTNRKEVKP